MPENATHIAGVSEQILDLGGERLRSLDTRMRQSIRQRPILYVVGALAVGCLVGRIVSRL